MFKKLKEQFKKLKEQFNRFFDIEQFCYGYVEDEIKPS